MYGMDDARAEDYAQWISRKTGLVAAAVFRKGDGWNTNDRWLIEVRANADQDKPSLTIRWVMGDRFDLEPGGSIEGFEELAARARVPADEHLKLMRHVRAEHGNLLGAGPEVRVGFTPLPTSGLSKVPMCWFLAVHAAAHIGTSDHAEDDWLCRDLAAARSAR